MNIKKILISALAAANVVSITAGLILTAAGRSLADSQSCNQAAQRWAPNGGYTQISCFFTEDSGFSTDTLLGLKSELTSKLKNISIIPEDGKELIPDAYSADAGQMSMRGDSSGRSESRVTAVGGSFFLFHNFKLIDGAYFSDKDIMQDCAVIDRSLAWALYGSSQVAGMNIYINGTKFFISGVIEDPQTKQEKKTAGDVPRAYISYEGADLINGGESTLSGDIGDMDGAGGFYDNSMKKISCYECIVPDPVENYAYNSVKEYLESSYKETSTLVNNSERFTPSKMTKIFKKLSNYAVVDKPIVYPYWENASRIIEFKLAEVYFFRSLTYIIPILTALLLLVILWRAAGRLRRKITAKTSDSVTKLLYKQSQKKQLKKEQKEEQKHNKK